MIDWWDRLSGGYTLLGTEPLRWRGREGQKGEGKGESGDSGLGWVWYGNANHTDMDMDMVWISFCMGEDGEVLTLILGMGRESDRG